jgi:ElaB/YqjD/DUF883 family membrane-anchored ribosome-binding protein
MDKTSNHLNRAKAHAEEAASQVLEEGIKKAAEIESELEECADRLVLKIQANPLTSVLIAAGIGYVFAKLRK